MIGRPSPSASAREAKAARRSWIRRSSSPARARIAPPGVLEVGQVSAYFLAGYDPGNVTWTGKGSQDANSGVKERRERAAPSARRSWNREDAARSNPGRRPPNVASGSR